MAELWIRTARHTAEVAAPPERVYELIADVNRWPEIFDPVITVEYLGNRDATERVRVWELAGGEVRGSVSHRELNPGRLQIRFRHEETPHPIASLGGLWLVLPKGSGSTVVLDHHYRVAGEDPADADWLARSIDATGVEMLAALREAAELGDALEPLWLSCVDGVNIAGDPRDVYDFLARAHDWPQRLPHIEALKVEEDVFDIQHLEAGIRLPNGSVHATSIVRVCFPETRIAYKQLRTPAIMRAHTGTFTITALPHGVRATSAHTALLRRDKVAGQLARGSTLDDVRSSVRDVLRSLSRATLGRAKQFAEARRPLWADAS
jgi:aromatase